MNHTEAELEFKKIRSVRYSVLGKRNGEDEARPQALAQVILEGNVYRMLSQLQSLHPHVPWLLLVLQHVLLPVPPQKYITYQTTAYIIIMDVPPD